MKDDELLARLRAADPAATASAPASDINRLMEAAMATDRTARTSAVTISTRVERLPHRRRRFALAAAAVAVLLVGGGATWRATAGDGTNRNQAPSSDSLALTLAAGGDSKCMEPTVDLLRRFDVAFEASVTSQDDDQVVFGIDHWFKGGDADTVRLTNEGAGGWSESLVFEVGQRYLVTAEDGVVPVCGGTNLATAEGEALFHEAFDR